MLWALAKLEIQPQEATLLRLLAQIRKRFTELNAQNLANVIWALSQLGYRPEQLWLEQFLQATLRAFSSCRPEDLAGTLQALAKMQQQPGREWLQRSLVEAYGQLQVGGWLGLGAGLLWGSGCMLCATLAGGRWQPSSLQRRHASCCFHARAAACCSVMVPMAVPAC